MFHSYHERSSTTMTVNADRRIDFYSLLAAAGRSPEIPESADVYGWLCGSWELDVLHYWGIDVASRGIKGEVHAGRVHEGRAGEDVWIMPGCSGISVNEGKTMILCGA